jgi:hypothetical protein
MSSPQPLIAVWDWLVVANPADGKMWRSSFLPEGWMLIQDRPCDLRFQSLARLDHALMGHG